MTTITPDLREKIERRARRAWRRRRDGAKKTHVSRVSDVTDKELKYRLPYTPDYYGKETVRVVRHDDGSIEVDPKTKGLIVCTHKTSLKKLKKHGDKVHAFIRTDQKAEVGRTGLMGKAKLAVGQDFESKSAVQFHAREVSVGAVEPGDRVFMAEFEAEDIVTHGTDYVTVKKFTIIDELDQEKDLGFTTKLLVCNDKADLEKLKKHIGTVRLWFLRKKEKRTFNFALPFSFAQDDRLKSRQCIVNAARPGDRVWEVELDYSAITKREYYDGYLKAKECKLIRELDEKADLGFTRGGIIDLLKKEDYVKLRKHYGMVRAYKYTDKDGKSPVQSSGKLTYEEGKDYEVKDADTSDTECGPGINVASAEWCQGYTKDSNGNRIFAFEFHTDDIAAIPPSDTKLRVSKCKCVDEVDTKTLKPLNPKPAPPPAPPPVAADEDKPDPPKGFFGKLFGG